ncbi:MAG: hypothetical protein JXB07_13260 [Anaerolineae bacterium]|nr:hypothetical protein [Anaerolineae bacterium]
MRILSMLLVLQILTGCGNAAEPLEEQAEATIAAPLPTPMELPTHTSVPANVALAPTGEGLLPGLTGYELLMARLGTAVYTGYLCSVIAEPGCVCDQAVIQNVTFTFVTDNRMLYAFGGSGYAAEWPMDRLGPDQWGYTFGQGISESGSLEGSAPGDYSYMLQFTEDGYTLTQGAYVGSTFVSCPTITFRRLMTNTATP